MQVVITMAGRGSRFKSAGYEQKKFKIEARGRTLFWWSMYSLKNFFNEEFIFVCLKEDEPHEFIKNQCELLGIYRYNILTLDDVTDGQASTVLEAKDYIKDDFIIYNIDTYVDNKHLKKDYIKGDGWIPVFFGEGDAWSFVKVDEHNRAIEVKEKERISNWATIGLYYFKSLEMYQDAYDNLIKTKGEKYVAPMYNRLIENGKEVTIRIIPNDAVKAMGTPEELEIFV